MIRSVAVIGSRSARSISPVPKLLACSIWVQSKTSREKSAPTRDGYEEGVVKRMDYVCTRKVTHNLHGERLVPLRTKRLLLRLRFEDFLVVEGEYDVRIRFACPRS